MKPLRLSAFAVVLVLTACSSSPTATPLRDPQSPPRLSGATATAEDGGNTLGSGNTSATASDGGNTLGSGTRSDSTETGRGGNTLGSGN